ncbi:hypothetical protein FNF27_07930 [Cafeteria roenbergensis]|uniref:Uncharacterized protein n=1 Tax=Cafeteria roenbergensis TaxID=33653 RepID=A0A5A8DDH1_CAFRO|nr:hypothetical protein FNF27_07930 [Cafeteria roenbergensis]
MDIDGQHYVAVANHRDNTWSYTIDSAVYRWAPSSVEWQEHQRLRTTGAIDLEHMVIGGQHYLAVANHYDGSSFAVNSIVYRWSEALLEWEEHQSIPTIGATDWLHIEVDGSHFLVVANSGADALRGGPSVDSIVFQWESSLLRWEVHQRIATKGARDWEHMVIDGQHYLAVANSYDGTTRAVDSVVYRWSSATLAWVEHQRIPTLGARDWQFVDTGIQQYLAVANYFDGVSYSVDSVIYVWSPVALAWQVHQSIRTDGAWDWEHMLVGGLHILAVANHIQGSSRLTDSVIYNWNSTTLDWDEHQRVPTVGATSWGSMTIDHQQYLGVTNYHDGNTAALSSFIFHVGHSAVSVGPASGSRQPSTALRVLARLPCGRDAHTSLWDCSATLGHSAVSLVPAVVSPDGTIPCLNHSAFVHVSMPSGMVELSCDWPLEAAAANASIAVLALADDEDGGSVQLHAWDQTGGVNVVGPAPLAQRVQHLQSAGGWQLAIDGYYFGKSPTVWRGSTKCSTALSNGTQIVCWCAASVSHAVPEEQVVVVAGGQSSTWRNDTSGPSHGSGSGLDSGVGHRWAVMKAEPPAVPWGPITLIGVGMLEGLRPSAVVLVHLGDRHIQAECSNVTVSGGEVLRCWPPLRMPAPGPYSAQLDGIAVLNGSAVLDASAGVSAVLPWRGLDPSGGELVLIRTRHSLVRGLGDRGVNLSMSVAVTLGGQPCSRAEVDGEFTVACISPPGTGAGKLVEVVLGGGAVVVSSNATWPGHISAGATAGPSYAEPEIVSLSPPYVLVPPTGRSNATIFLSGSSFVRSSLLGLRIGDFACGSVAVLSDSSAVCEALALPSSLAPGQGDSTSLNVRVEWGSPKQLTQKQPALTVAAIGGPSVLSVQSSSWLHDRAPTASHGGVEDALPDSWVLIRGAELGRRAEDLRGISVGGVPCASTEWFSPTKVGCLLPAVSAFGDSSAPLTNLTVQVETTAGRRHAFANAVSLRPPSLSSVVSGGEVAPGVPGNVSLVGEGLEGVAVGLRAGGEWECAAVSMTSSPQAVGGPTSGTTGANNASGALLCSGLTVGASVQGGSLLSLELEWPRGSGRWVGQPGVWLLTSPDPVVSAVTPSSAAPSSWLLVGGSGLGRWAEDLRGISVGGVPCAATEWFSPTKVGCLLPAVSAFGDSSAPLTNLTVQVETTAGRRHAFANAVSLRPPSLSSVVSGGEVAPGVPGNVSLVGEGLEGVAVGLRAGGEWECAAVSMTSSPQAVGGPTSGTTGANNASGALLCSGLTVGASVQGGSLLSLELEWPRGSGRWVGQPGVWLLTSPDPVVSAVTPSGAWTSKWCCSQATGRDFFKAASRFSE